MTLMLLGVSMSGVSILVASEELRGDSSGLPVTTTVSTQTRRWPPTSWTQGESGCVVEAAGDGLGSWASIGRGMPSTSHPSMIIQRAICVRELKGAALGFSARLHFDSRPDTYYQR